MFTQLWHDDYPYKYGGLRFNFLQKFYHNIEVFSKNNLKKVKSTNYS